MVESTLRCESDFPTSQEPRPITRSSSEPSQSANPRWRGCACSCSISPFAPSALSRLAFRSAHADNSPLTLIHHPTAPEAKLQGQAAEPKAAPSAARWNRRSTHPQGLLSICHGSHCHSNTSSVFWSCIDQSAVALSRCNPSSLLYFVDTYPVLASSQQLPPAQ